MTTTIIGGIRVPPQGTRIIQEAAYASTTIKSTMHISTKSMKVRRDSHWMTICSFCSKSHKERLLCGRCKVAAYCSRECQKKQWPSHKLVCQDSKAAAKFKFVSTLMGNKNIEILLMMAFVQTFELRENMTVDGPLIARCDLAIDSEDLSLIFGLASGHETPEDFPDGVQGMVQIKSFTPLDPNVAMDTWRWKMWGKAKTESSVITRRIGPIRKIATGLIDFHMEGTDQVLTFPIHIHDKEVAIVAAMSGEQDVVVSESGKKAHVIVGPMMTIGILNGHILDDRKNILRLRSHMPKEALYKYVGDNVNQQHIRMLPTDLNMGKNLLEVGA